MTLDSSRWKDDDGVVMSAGDERGRTKRDRPSEPAATTVSRQESGLGSPGEGITPGRVTALLQQIAAVPDVEPDAGWSHWLAPGAVVGRFEMVREIGRGGFGVVWEARDQELGRSVAFKAVRVGGQARLREERLLREAEAAARLSHPNILTLHDLGRTEQGPYLVLELLNGETLRDRLDRGPVPVRDAVRIAVEIAKGMAHAHAQGVVHRDLKPANVFLCEDGQVKVLDFGMAHAFGRRRQDGGTPAYMAPEQWARAPEDERTDVFALGTMLFEMTSGELPFPADDGGKAVRSGRKPAVLEVPKAPALGELVGKMLDKDPTRRPRDGGEVLAELSAIHRELEQATSPPVVTVRTRRRSWRVFAPIAAGILVGMAVAAVAMWRLAEPRPAGGRPVVVAVADFANETRDPDLDGLSGLLITSLEQSKKLRVLTRGRMIDLVRELGEGNSPHIDESLARAVGRKAGVRTLLLASIQKLGDTYAAELRAVDPQKDDYLFTLREQATTKNDLLPLIDRLSDRTRLALREPDAEVKASEVNLAEAVTGNLEAYRHYFRGKELAARGELEGAVAEYRRAVEIEPGFALARLEVAWVGYFWSEESRISARDAVRQASSGAAHAPAKEAGLIRVLKAFFDGQFAACRAEIRPLATRYPEDRDVAVLAAEVLTWCGEVEGALPYYEQALRLAPDWDVLRLDQVTLLNYAGRGKEALALAQTGVRQRATPMARVAAALARYLAGDVEGGIAAIRTSEADDVFSKAFLAEGLASQGRFEEALASVAGLDQRLGDLARAQVLAYAGRLREGLAAMEVAAKRPGADVAFVRQATAWYLSAAGDLEGARRMASQGDFFTVLDGAMLVAIGSERRLKDLLAEVGPETLFYGRFLRALAAHRAGDRNAALGALRALDRGGASFAPYYRGLIATESGLDEEAVDALSRFCRAALVGSDAYPAPWLVARARYLTARSLDRLGRRDEARKVLDLQLARWKDADRDLPLLAEMRALRARLSTAPAAE